MVYSQAVRTFTPLTTSHVAGHTGDPFNELANTFANSARICGIACIPELDALFDLLLDDAHAAQWLWARSQPHKAGFEVGVQGEWFIPCPAEQHEVARDNFLQTRAPDPEHHSSTQPASLTTVDCVLATHNVLTLNDFSKNGKRIPPQPSARLLHLEAQWKQQRCALVGLQETRSYKEQCVTTKEGFVFITAANKGVGGCGLFVNAKQAYGQTLDGPLFFSRKHFTIVASEAEYLIVRVRATGLHVLVVVAHAPSLDKGESVRCTFWDLLTTLLQPYSKEKVILLVDANDTLDHPSQESAFQEFVRRHHIFLPSCIPALHQGASWTHTSAKGQLRKRLDYVGVPAQWEESAELFSTVAYDADVAITRADHELVTVAFRKEGDGCKAPRFRRAVPYHNPLRPQAAEHEFWRMRLRDLQKATTECVDFKTTTCPDQHAMALHHILLQEACQVFPKQKAEPRKPYVSLEALQLLRHRSRLRRTKQAWETVANKWTLWFYFKAWNRQPPHGSWGAHLDHNIASLQRAFDTTCWLLRQRLHADKRQYFETLGQRIPDNIDEKKLAHLWPILKFALPKQATKPARTLPREQMTSHALNHFATIESGHVCTKELLWEWHSKSPEPADYGAFPVDFFPTLAEIEGVLAGFKHYKSPGEDLLTADLLQAGSTPLAQLVLPLVTKCFATGQLPVVFQGATLIPLYKGKGPAHQLDSYRSIVLAPTLAKLVQALLRRRVLPYVLPHFGPFQLGGRPRGQVAFCTQAVRAFWNVAKHQRRPAAVLFIDVKQAFYSLPRHHAVGPFLNRDEYSWLLRQLKASQDTYDKCYGACAAPIPTALQEVPPHVMRLLRSLVRHGWLADQHDDACAFTLTGTRPGLPLADLLFNVAMVEVLTHLQRDLASHGIVSSLFSEQPETFPLVAWQDDVALAFDGADNAELRARMDLVVALVLQRFEEAHMTINFSRGKTEMIAVYRGTGATAHQREDVIAHKGLIRLTEKQIDVVAVAKYKHLGSIIQGDAEMDSEVWARIGAASEALRKGALRIRGLSLQCRLGLLDALVFSRLFYNVGTWVTLHRPAWKAMHQCYHRAVRAAVRLPAFDVSAETHGYALRKAGLPDLAGQLRLRRLQHLGHLARAGPPELLRILETECAVTDQSWSALIAHDLQWLRACGGDFAGVAPVYGSGIAVVPWVAQHLR